MFLYLWFVGLLVFALFVVCSADLCLLLWFCWGCMLMLLVSFRYFLVLVVGEVGCLFIRVFCLMVCCYSVTLWLACYYLLLCLLRVVVLYWLIYDVIDLFDCWWLDDCGFDARLNLGLWLSTAVFRVLGFVGLFCCRFDFGLCFVLGCWVLVCFIWVWFYGYFSFVDCRFVYCSAVCFLVWFTWLFWLFTCFAWSLGFVLCVVLLLNCLFVFGSLCLVFWLFVRRVLCLFCVYCVCCGFLLVSLFGCCFSVCVGLVVGCLAYMVVCAWLICGYLYCLCGCLFIWCCLFIVCLMVVLLELFACWLIWLFVFWYWFWLFSVWFVLWFWIASLFVKLLLWRFCLNCCMICGFGFYF